MRTLVKHITNAVRMRTNLCKTMRLEVWRVACCCSRACVSQSRREVRDNMTPKTANNFIIGHGLKRPFELSEVSCSHCSAASLNLEGKKRSVVTLQFNYSSWSVLRDDHKKGTAPII